MKTTILTTVLLTLLLAGAAHAATRPAPKTVWIYGDSISLGYGFGQYDYPSPLERIDLIANTLAAANGSTIRFRRAGTQEPAAICRDVATKTIRAQDDIVFEDAGPHTDTAADYARWLGLVAFCATHGNVGVKPRPGRQLIFGTMFDYGNPYNGDAAYDAPFKKTGAPLTPNDIYRQTASHARATILDWNRAMDAAYATLEPQGVHVVNPGDGIHPTVWGNVVIAVAILRHEGVPVTNTDAVVAELVAASGTLTDKGFSPPLSADQTRGWLQATIVAAQLS